MKRECPLLINGICKKIRTICNIKNTNYKNCDIYKNSSKLKKSEYQISYDHGNHGANEITGIDGINELKKTIAEVRKEGHQDIKIWKKIWEKE